MKPLSLIYWTKVCLGALAAFICILLGVNNLFTGIGVGLLIYLISDRILKQLFIEKVKPSVIIKTGIGIYIISWVFFWILLYTLLNPSL